MSSLLSRQFIAYFRPNRLNRKTPCLTNSFNSLTKKSWMKWAWDEDNLEKSDNCHIIKGMSHFEGSHYQGYVTISWVCHNFMGMSHFQGYVTLWRVCQTIKGMSHYQGYVILSRVCHTIKGMSHYQGYVTLSRVCHTYKGMSNYQGYVKLLRMS